MLQELLVALYGFPGAIFVESSNNDPDADEVETQLVPISDNLPFVPPGELALHSELLKLGSCYRVLEKFIRRYAGPCRSLYLAAIACGFDDALKDYRQALFSLESEVLADQDLDIAYFSYRLHSYKLLLPVLARLARKIETSYGISEKSICHPSCRILDTILLSAPPGLPKPRAVVRKLFAHTMRIFYRQLSSWLLYGILHDPHDEFFVVGTRVGAHDEGCDEALNPPVGSAHQEWITDGDQDEDVEISFSLDVSRIPSFLPTSFAQYVLFAGEAVNLSVRDSARSSLLCELERKFSDRFVSLEGALQVKSEEQEGEAESSISPLVDLTSLQTLVTDVRSFISHRIWRSLVEEDHLLTYMSTVKDVLLLGRGELFLSFIDQLCALEHFDAESLVKGVFNRSRDFPTSHHRGLLDRPPPTDVNEICALEFDVTATFLAAARSVGLDDEKLDSHFKFTISPGSSDAEAIHPEDQTVWDNLNLHLIVPPAFRVVFSPQVCRGYSRLFRYLITVRRTQLALQQYWADQTFLWRCVCAPTQFGASALDSASRMAYSSRSPVELAELQATINKRLLVRSYMAFIVENLQYFLQVDVIESQFSYLVRRIQSEQEADLIQVAHEAYLAGLQAQALLFHPAARPCVLKLLSVCRRFVQVSHRIEAQYHMSDLEESLIRDFKQLSSSLFRCLSCSSSTGAQSSVGLEVGARNYDQPVGPTADLSQLLLRLDFNHFYSQSQGGFRTWSSSEMSSIA
ncbi:unnamed protein product [Calicophoron daubneyi]|uniref:Gamma-tubulin complex component n=1 Tax=Calicophoron daubneyi TaxID=300641 RepID=A0AAV2TR19_CALDB